MKKIIRLSWLIALLVFLACSVAVRAEIIMNGNTASGWSIVTPSYAVQLSPERGILIGLTRAGSSVNTVSSMAFAWHPDRNVWLDDWDVEDISSCYVDWKSETSKFNGGITITFTAHNDMVAIARTYTFYDQHPWMKVRYEITGQKDSWTNINLNYLPWIVFGKTLNSRATPGSGGVIDQAVFEGEKHLVESRLNVTGNWFAAYDSTNREGVACVLDRSIYGWFRKTGALYSTVGIPQQLMITHPALINQVTPLCRGQKLVSEFYLIPYQGDPSIVADKAVRELNFPMTLPKRRPSNMARLVADKNGAAVWTETSQSKVYTDTVVPSQNGASVTINMARNEAEAFQIAVTAGKSPIKGAKLSAISNLTGSSGTLSSKNIYYNVVGNVTIAVSAPFETPVGLHPDPLLPEKSVDIPAGETRTFWVTVRAPGKTAPGTYSGTLTVSGDNLPNSDVKLSVRIAKFVMPDTDKRHLRTDMGLWINHLARNIKDPSKLEETILAYGKNFYEHGMSGRMQPGSPTGQGGTLVDGLTGKELAGLESWMRVTKRQIDDYKFNTFCLPLPEGFFKNISHVQGEPDGFVFTEAFGKSITDFYKVLGPKLRAVDPRMMDRSYVYMIDEPMQWAYYKVKETAKAIKAADPSIRTMATMFPNKDLYGTVDIWCPNRDHPYETEEVKKLISDRKKAGEEVWWYDNSVGIYRISQPAIEHRIFFWQTWDHGIQGILGWGINCGGSPWKDNSVSMNGDGRLIYPNPKGEGGPINSIRWELCRDGAEDFELLYAADMKAKTSHGKEAASIRALLDDCRAMMPGRKEYVDDPARFEALRVRLLDAVSR